MATYDLLTDALAGLSEGDRASRGPLYTYNSTSQQWFADIDRVEEGDAQTTRTLHLTTNKNPKWHRTYVNRHFFQPLVAVSFRIEDYDPIFHGDNTGFKLAYNHQSTLAMYHVQFKVDGTCSIFKEHRDGVDAGKGQYGHTLASGAWQYQPGVRHHLVVKQAADGRLHAMLDDAVHMSTVVGDGKDEDSAPIRSGQIGFRLDGTTTTLHSLVVREF